MNGPTSNVRRSLNITGNKTNFYIIKNLHLWYLEKKYLATWDGYTSSYGRRKMPSVRNFQRSINET